MPDAIVLAVHAGAGRVRPFGDASRETQRAALAEALVAGRAALERGGTALDAVGIAVEVLEACPEMNAGVGSALTEIGTPELDASIMEGSTRRAGAVAGVSRVLHPVAAARAVLDDGRHVMLIGEAADAWSIAQGVDPTEPGTFVTEHRRAQLARVLARQEKVDGGSTVGAVARDPDGGLAAATSTGGLTGKRCGRVSDSALIGSGTWADDGVCAISATGEGEYFIRAGFARSIAARVEHAGQALADACDTILADVAALGGTGGCIAIDARGGVALRCNTEGMFRGVIRGAGDPEIAIEAEASLTPHGALP